MGLIKVATDANGKQVVSARDLHVFLEAGSDVNTWFKNQVKRAMLEEGIDFTQIYGESTGGRPSIDYAISLSSAKEISMLNGGDKGKEARLYFIACENKLKEIAKPMSQLDILAMSVALLQKQAQELLEVKSDIQELRAKQSIRDEAYYTVSGYASIRGIKIDSSRANLVGRKCVKESKEAGIDIGTVHDAHYGKINSYHLDVLSVVFEKEFKK